MRSRNFSWPFVAGLVLLCLRPEVQAETISIVAADNAWVFKGNQPDNDQSEATNLDVRSNGSHLWSKLTYLRFDLSSLAGAKIPGATITSASLDMYWVKADNNNSVYVCALNDLADGGLGNTETTWTSNQTWNTRLTGTQGLPNAKTSGLLASLSSTGNQGKVVRFGLTSALPGLLATDTNNQLTLILYGTSGQSSRDQQFASLGNADVKKRPTLKVGYEPIPEPGTLALLGMALVAVAWWQNIASLAWHAWRKAAKKGLARLLAVWLLCNALLGIGWWAWRSRGVRTSRRDGVTG